MWTPEEWDIERLKMMAWNSWDRQTKFDTVNTIASYGTRSLKALTDLATCTWDQDFRAYVLDKIKQINEIK